MNNEHISHLAKIVEIEVTGKNINYFINKMIKQKRKIIDLNIVDRKRAIIKVYYNDYLEMIEEKSTYKITKTNSYGRLKLVEHIKRNIFLYSFIIVGIALIIFLSNIVFDIEVIHTNSEIRELLYKELDRNGIKKYTFKKNYEKLETIINNILESNKNKIEWLEIEVSGTKYIVRVQDRKIIDNKEEYIYQDIIASKSAIIYKVSATSGVILKQTYEYVTKGDVVISGTIVLPNNTSILTKAEGKVYGEVWYKVTSFYPYVYREEIYTGKKKQVYVINFLNKRISLFDYNKYNTYKADTTLIIGNNLLPFNLVKEKQYELNVIDEVLTKEETLVKVVEKAKKELLTNLKEDAYINYEKILKTELTANGVNVEIFFSVIEEIGVSAKLEENNY